MCTHKVLVNGGNVEHSTMQTPKKTQVISLSNPLISIKDSNNRTIMNTTEENWTLEYARLKARVEVLERNQRNFMGQDLQCLSLKELQNLEQQLDSALKQVRSRRVVKPCKPWNQLIYEDISVLQEKGSLSVSSTQIRRKVNLFTVQHHKHNGTEQEGNKLYKETLFSIAKGASLLDASNASALILTGASLPSSTISSWLTFTP
ncbi:hypothetical protein Ahy_B10g102093 [Arachis hypogaea]|uniref:K-box domain-containing protein n=1 Tax=Arachis hypogaea TaxID=3818 RepID=A0A444X160_ARAHY|nr:hypothetical protein Ahy_B10g102093 [Arachis hypogaea]